jgi:inosose dehydratase
VVNPNPKDWDTYTPKTDAELRLQAAELNRLGEALLKRGVALCLHHHWTEVADNVRELRHLFKNTNPALCWFCIDVHWVYRGGQDPVAILEEAGSRIGNLHLRNCREGIIWEDFTEGDIDYGRVAALLKKIGYAGLLTVELWYEKATKITRSRVENLRNSREYAERLFQVKA